MSLLKSLPTTLWMVGATVAIAAFSPVVGGAVTATAPAPQPAPPAQPAPPPQPEQPSTPSQPAQPTQPSQPEQTVPVQTVAPSRPAATDSVAPGNQVVVKRAVTGLGPTAVDAEGYTLYLSVLDSTDPPQSVCLSQKCLTAWKPVYLQPGVQPTAGAGIDPGRLGRVKRPDKTWQATLGGWPLYRYYGDTAPGDVNGEGLKGTWHAIGPDGKKAAR